MLAEREVLVSVLKLTKDGPTKIEDIARDAHVLNQVTHQVLKRNSGLRLIRLDGKSVTVEAEQRLRVAGRAIELGADVERVCKLLTWEEFEDISILAFEANDYMAKKHFRFSWSGKRWEIDILGLREPILASVDCKQWHRGWSGSANRKAAERQMERTRALAEASASVYGKLGIREWKNAYFVPIVLSLVPGVLKFHRGLPIVPVLQLRDFLQKMPAHIDKIAHFSRVSEDGKPERY